jgi:DNA-binding CsgD family transcriptional regulator
MLPAPGRGVDSAGPRCHDEHAGPPPGRLPAGGSGGQDEGCDVNWVPPATARVESRPLVVIEAANPSADAHSRDAIDAARAAGWAPVAGWLVPRGRSACCGDVASEADAVLALRAAVGGAGVIVLARCPRETIDRLVDDLRRLGSVRHVTADVPAPATIDAEQRSLLRMLADGSTLGEAAAELGISRRTADRRLDAARRALGTDRTAEALATARALGWFDRDGAPT